MGRLARISHVRRPLTPLAFPLTKEFFSARENLIGTGRARGSQLLDRNRSDQVAEFGSFVLRRATQQCRHDCACRAIARTNDIDGPGNRETRDHRRFCRGSRNQHSLGTKSAENRLPGSHRELLGRLRDAPSWVAETRCDRQ